MNLVVFGAAGWLGRAVLANLEGRHRVRAFDRSPEAWHEWADVDGDGQPGERVYGDIADFSTVYQATEGMDGIRTSPPTSARERTIRCPG